MSLTIGGALRAHLLPTWAEPFGVNQRVFADTAPEGATFPYVTFIDQLSDTPALSGDAQVLAKSCVVQVDLWQKRGAESDALRLALERACNHAVLALEDEQGYPVATFTTRWRSTVRVPDPDRAVVHHSLTVAVAHRSGT